MRNGTQEELDAAREDVTLLPFDAKFKIKQDFTRDRSLFKACGMEDGASVWRNLNEMDDSGSVCVSSDVCNSGYFINYFDLEVIK